MASKEQTDISASAKELEAALNNYSDALEQSPQTTGEPLPDSVMQGIVRLINQAKTAFLPSGSTLTPVERRRLIGSNYKNYGFIDQAYASAMANPALVPSYLKINTFKINMDDFARKRNLYEAIKQFELQVSDAMLVASDVAFHDALVYYNYVKEAARQRVPGAEAVYKSLKDYFKRSKQSSDKPTELEIERDVRALLHGKKDGQVIVENEQPVISRGKHNVIDEVHSGHASIRKDLDTRVDD